jgi:hypothetical protein
VTLPALAVWLALAASAHAQSQAQPGDSVIGQAATDIRTAPDERTQNVVMSQLIATLGDTPRAGLTDNDITDLGALARGGNLYVADMATQMLGCEGARARFVLPMLEHRLTDAVVNKPPFYSGIQSDEFLRIAIWRIRTNTTCDRPTPDVMSRVSPVAVG